MSKRILPFWIYISLLTVVLAVATFSARPVWAAGASISGTVTDEASQPVANATVGLARNMLPEYGYDYWNYVGTTTTDEIGNYTLTDLVAGTYRIKFSDETFPPTYATSHYSQQRYAHESTPITVAEDETVIGINAQLLPRGSLGGRVTNENGDPIDNISVKLDLQEFSYQGDDYWSNVATTLSDSNGYYRVDALDLGNYRVLFDDDSGARRYVSAIYDNAVLYESATSVVVTAGELITGINATLAQPGNITGLVTTSAGQPLANVAVTIHYFIDDPLESYWSSLPYVYTDENGLYAAHSLLPGRYRIGFSDNNYPQLYAPEYFDNAIDLDRAIDITVTSGLTVTNINAELAEYGKIRGRVTNPANEPIIDATVTLYKYYPDAGNWLDTMSIQTNEAGDYEFAGLLAGSYRLYINPSYYYPGDYAPEYYNNAATIDEATTIQVAQSEVVDNIDVQVQPYGQITGQVTDAEGQPLENINVLVYQYLADSEVWNAFTTSTTDASGYYTIRNLNTQLYRLEFSAPCCPVQYLSEFYDNATNLADATSIPVQLGQTVSGIDAQLDRFGLISGRVTGEDGQGLADVGVDVLYQMSNPAGPIWTSSSFAYTDSDGYYSIRGLTNDNYRVRFNYERVGGYVPAYWQDTIAYDSATTIPVSINSITTGIDAQLTKGGSIGGTARTVDGRTYYIRIVLYQYRSDAMGEDPWYPLRTLYYDGNSYLFDGLDAGVYRIGFFDDQDPGYHKEFYPDQPYVETAQSFTLALGQQITGIDAIFEWSGDTDFPPHANDDAITLFEGSRTTRLDNFDISLLQNDKDDWEYPTVPLTATLVGQPQHGRATVAADGQFSYQHDGSDTTSDLFTYQAHDEIQGSNIATVTVNIIPVNEKPYAIADRIVVMRGESTSVLESGVDTLSANDLDPEGDPLTVTLTTGPQHGTLSLDPSGTFTYTHDGGSTDSDSFTYRASDGQYTSEPATVAVIIKPAARFAFSKTVGIEEIEPACTPATEIHAPRGTTMIYCYTVTNTGEVPLLYHSLSDSHLGILLTDAPYLLLPGGSYSVQFTQTLMISTTNVATWTASTGPTATARTQRNPQISAGSRTAATVLISSVTDDLDGDTIPDNVEGAGDPDHDNIPNFLDTDADNDGLLDRDEVGTNPATPIDSNNNGFADYLENERRLYLPVIAK